MKKQKGQFDPTYPHHIKGSPAQQEMRQKEQVFKDYEKQLEKEVKIIKEVSKESINDKIDNLFAGDLNKIKERQEYLRELKKNLPLYLNSGDLLEVGKQLASTQEIIKSKVDFEERWKKHLSDSKDLKELIAKADNAKILEIYKAKKNELLEEEIALMEEDKLLREIGKTKQKELTGGLKDEVNMLAKKDISPKKVIDAALELSGYQYRFIDEHPDLAKKINFKPYQVSVGKIIEVMEEQEITRKLLEMKKNIKKVAAE
ncbi:MAG: hypothetical protein US50_C0044G0009 [Candidatus Nomurabacteria bacterium GW2011_GWB1_37_5]|uniref:Uncharacterized protein n=1 Tax=Candidatus Nomurabacteria bacterium GW2011_GWB1_37_5 TaxID=1618742 RepID=A0A0G0K1L2_9BACT|nr:MAG: hypothetical protein US50_C0044G0009 [Candidatus Nomurabacteria bacterium GW2011_GWB1_37_5]